MRILSTIIISLICHPIFGQGKIHYNITKPNGGSTFWFKFMSERARKLSLPSLDTFSGTEYIRIWTSSQVIEIWYGERGDAGRLTTWTDEYVGNGEEPTDRAFSKTKQLSRDTVLLLNRLLKTSEVLALPTGDSIAGWQNGFDGIICHIEHFTRTKHSFKSYWTPKAQGSLKEALQFSTFIDSALQLASAASAQKEFSKEIPFESYWNGGPGVAVRILTPKERTKYRKERQDYRCKHFGKRGTK